MNHKKTEIIPIPSGYSTIYLLKNEKSVALIDTGIWSTRDKILQAIENKGVSLKNINLIIVTHAHYDHCGNAKMLKELKGAKILIHQN